MQFLDKAGLTTLVTWARNTFAQNLKVVSTNNKAIGTDKDESGVTFAGGTNKFTVSDGTNSFDVPITLSISNNITGSGTSGQAAVFNGTNSLTGRNIATSVATDDSTSLVTEGAVKSYVDDAIDGLTAPNDNTLSVKVGAVTNQVFSADANTDSIVEITGGGATSVSMANKVITISSTDEHVTSAANHYSPSTDSGSALSVDASGATAAWGIDVVTGVNISRDSKGHITGLTVDSGKIPANPVSANTVTTTSTLGADTVVLGNGNKTVKNSSYTLGGATLASSPSSTVLATEAAVADAVSGLSGAMHFVGTTSGTMTDGQTTNPTVSGVSSFSAGDVVVDSTETEFVLGNEATPKWHKLGDANSYALSNNVVNSWKGTGDDWITVSPTTATKGAVSATFSHGGNGAAFSAKGSATKVPQITTDSKGHVTNITEVTITQPSVNNAALTIAADSGTGTQAFTANSSTASSITFAGGNHISTAVSGSANAPTVTINHDAAGTGSAITTSQGTASAASAGTSYDVVTDVTVSADEYGHITGVSTTRQKVVSNQPVYSGKLQVKGSANDATATDTGFNANSNSAGVITFKVGTGDTISSITTSGGEVTINGATMPTAVTESTVSGWGFTKNAGTVTSITPGVGLVNGSGNKTAITSSGTIKAALNSETSLGTIGTTAKLYAVGVDSNGKLAVNVPWTDGGTTDEAIPESELLAILYPDGD